MYIKSVHQKCTSKVYIKSVHQKCTSKVYIKSVHQKCTPNRTLLHYSRRILGEKTMKIEETTNNNRKGNLIMFHNESKHPRYYFAVRIFIITRFSIALCHFISQGLGTTSITIMFTLRMSIWIAT